MSIAIIDDEPAAHTVLAHLCRAHSDIAIVGHCHDAAQALTLLSSQPVDLMLLDIRMPSFGGLNLLRGLRDPPLTVIVSAHHEHAIEGFDLDVVDYLTKPVGPARFAAALARVRRRIAVRQPDMQADVADVVLKVDRTLRRFLLDDVAYFEAHGNFVRVWQAGGSCLATTTLRRLLDLLPPNRFVQVHRSFVVNRAMIAEQRPGALRLLDGRRIPIGKTYHAVRPL